MVVYVAIADFILLIIVIGLVDYLLFFKISACNKCGQKPVWYAWIPATAIELALFLLGVFFGHVLWR